MYSQAWLCCIVEHVTTRCRSHIYHVKTSSEVLSFHYLFLYMIHPNSLHTVSMLSNLFTLLACLDVSVKVTCVYRLSCIYKPRACERHYVLPPNMLEPPLPFALHGQLQLECDPCSYTYILMRVNSKG